MKDLIEVIVAVVVVIFVMTAYNEPPPEGYVPTKDRTEISKKLEARIKPIPEESAPIEPTIEPKQSRHIPANTPVYEEWDNPYAEFDANKNKYKTVKVIWKPVDDIQATCDAESIKRGFPAFEHAVRACSFQKADQCTIFTRTTMDMHTIGHEIMHCYQVDWH